MFVSHDSWKVGLSTILICALHVCLIVPAQTNGQQSRDDVVRVFTELVQTDVMVFDKQGRFVNGLKKEDFELKIDGKTRPIDSFDQISAGADEETQLASARGVPTTTGRRAVPLDRGRTVFFYVDDFHMDLSGMVRTRNLIKHFVDKEMGQNDQTAVASATGQIGFLQQLTTNKLMLRTAADRLTPRHYSVRDGDRPPMSEYEAMLIDRFDPTVFEFFVDETMRQNPGIRRDTAAQIVRARANAIQSQASALNQNMLVGLERLVKGVKALPGRKVVFFLSGGFLVQGRRGDERVRLQRITSEAARSGVVIYSMDVRGLVTGMPDASADIAFDPSGRLTMGTLGEVSATQDGLNALAADTGGRGLFNSNDLKVGLAPAIKETSAYYLLAWKPDEEKQKQSRFRSIQVSVMGHPDLVVRVRKGFFDRDPETKVAEKPSTKPEATKTVPVRLREAISAAYPTSDLPITLAVDYYDVANKGGTLSTAIHVPGEFLKFGEQPDGKIQAVIDVSAAFFDDKGVPRASYMERIVTTAPSLEAADVYRNDITFTYPTQLPPGLYQVRVAARDDKSGRMGTAYDWMEIPDLSRKALAMSSLLLGERTPAMMTSVSDTSSLNQVSLSGSHRFRRESNLRFLLFAYNTSMPNEQKPDIAVQVQVVRDDQPVITTALRKVSTDGVLDLTRLPYAAEIPLSELQPGKYILQVSLIDRVSRQSTSRQTQFSVY